MPSSAETSPTPWRAEVITGEDGSAVCGDGSAFAANPGAPLSVAALHGPDQYVDWHSREGLRGSSG